jgi:hypothetical protein
MPGMILPKGGAEKIDQIVIKTENFNHTVHNGSNVAFAEIFHFDNNSIRCEELWIWMKNKCLQWPYDSNKGLCTNKEQQLEISEILIQPIDKDKLKWIQECHDSPVAELPG